MTEQFHFLLMQTFNMTNRKMHSFTSQMGLDPGQPKILQVLYGSEGMTPKEIAAHCRMDKSTATLLIKRMIAGGLLKKTPAAEDRRSVIICLSDQGKELAEEVNKAGAIVDAKALKGLDASQIQQLKSLLETVQKNLEETE